MGRGTMAGMLVEGVGERRWEREGMRKGRREEEARGGGEEGRGGEGRGEERRGMGVGDTGGTGRGSGGMG